jgi:hypothetical protein
MKELLSFDTLVTPKIIVVLYFLGLLGVLVVGVGSIFSGHFLNGVLIIVFGALGVRVYFELLILFFKINEALQDIRKK